VKYRPIAVLAGVLVTAVALGAGAVAARRHPGHVAAFAGGSARRPVPSPAAGKTIRDLVAGDERTCALYTNGSVVCWGAFRRGAPAALGDVAPRRVRGVTGAVAVSVGDTHGCVLDAEGRVSCWGYCDPACQAGSGPLIFPETTQLTDVPRLTTMVSEQIGDTTCGVGADDQELHCWGPMSAGVTWFGDPVGPRLYHYGHELGGRGRFASGAHAGAVELMSAGYGSSCARYAGGVTRCWSDGLTNGENKPFASLDAPREPVARMWGSFSQQCFVLVSGAVECHSTDGILRLPFAQRAVSAAAAGSAVCATTVSGGLLCERYSWDSARDRYGADLSRGATFETRARAVGGTARLVVAGTHHFCVLRDDDAVYCWDEYGVGDPERVELPGPG
jgi:hypothetical protein